MDLQQLLDNLNPQIVGSLKRAVELGKWPNGAALTSEQKMLCAEAVRAWELRNLPRDAHVGYVPPKNTACGDREEEQPLNWR
ncbi:YeaC family protein [Microbulbifer yueqingensis]|uniref:PA-phosphatase n=1 Tax=Microbulbifer yueqingensis TaxID=658219 RepID=A0A1G9ETB9_9GAMM|nr:DUF1315 family protein [Microbulbifer yueqingensis]SDK79245.1 hypothetical protein SAMN05216212_3224 [Microbulbifer yueqingensis]